MQYTHFHGHTIAIGLRADYIDALQRILLGKTTVQAITLNPEYVVLATQNTELTKLTQPPSLVIPDGIGLVWALRSRALTVERYPGADSVVDICTFAQKNALRIAVLTTGNALSSPEEITQTITTRFPNLKILVLEEADTSVERIQQFQPQVIFATFGQPRQDLWLAQHTQDFPSLRLAMGVGGAFDFLTGKRKRAPRVMQHLGVEWLWRLLLQPQRFPRMFRATFGFWYTILTTP